MKKIISAIKLVYLSAFVAVGMSASVSYAQVVHADIHPNATHLKIDVYSQYYTGCSGRKLKLKHELLSDGKLRVSLDNDRHEAEHNLLDKIAEVLTEAEMGRVMAHLYPPVAPPPFLCQAEVRDHGQIIIGLPFSVSSLNDVVLDIEDLFYAADVTAVELTEL